MIQFKFTIVNYMHTDILSKNQISIHIQALTQYVAVEAIKTLNNI